MEKKPQDLVSATYAKAVAAAPLSSTLEPKSVVAKNAGYTPDELASVPKDAVINAFGCGNPVSFTEVKAGETVVDLGCGAGIDLILAARRVGPTGRVIGIDMTEEMLVRARANVASAGFSEQVEVKKGMIEELPIPSSSADWVISNCVINSTPEKARVFREIARV